MKFKPWQETLFSPRSPFKVLPSFFLSPTRSRRLLLSGCGTVKMQHQVHSVLRAIFLLYTQTAPGRSTAGAPGSCTPKTGLRRKGWLLQQFHHTKKRAWPFLFNLRIFPRRCLAVAIPFFGRLPIKYHQQCEQQWRAHLTAPEDWIRAPWQTFSVTILKGRGPKTLLPYHTRVRAKLLSNTYSNLQQFDLCLALQHELSSCPASNDASAKKWTSKQTSPWFLYYLTPYVYPSHPGWGSFLSVLLIPQPTWLTLTVFFRLYLLWVLRVT